jgi:hypothetical protein
MSIATYTPRAWSIPDRCIKHLAKLDKDAEISTARLAEALDVDANSLATILDPARKHGLLRATRKPQTGRVLYWSIGNGEPAPAPDDEDGDDAPLHPAPAMPGAQARSVFDMGASLAPAGETAARGRQSTSPDALRIALWSDGTLQIQRQAGEVVLSKAETAHLIAYLDRVLLERGGA